MDYLQMTASCGLDCFNCPAFLARENQEAMETIEEFSKEYGIPVEKMLCNGCRNHKGQPPAAKYLFDEDYRCSVYECCNNKNIKFCNECRDFPCDNLHPYADNANKVPHNTKVFNLCLINKMGLECWAKEKARNVKETYFTKPFTLNPSSED